MLETVTTAALVCGHVLALGSGLAVLHKYGPQLQTINRRQTFSIKEAYKSYLVRRVWALGITIPYTLWELFLIINGQNSVSTASFYGILITVVYHVDTYKDRRSRA